MPHLSIALAPVDYLILAVYFVFVLGIGWAAPATLHEDQQRLLPVGPGDSGLDLRSGLHLGEPRRFQEVIGMAASGPSTGS